MFCEKCGAEIADGAVFCNACGNSVKNEVETNENVNQPETEVNGATAVMTESGEINAAAGNIELNELPDVPKKGNGKIIAGGIVGLVAIIGILAWCLWDNIFFALAPEKYVGNLLDNTLEGMIEDIDDITENIFGMKFENDDDWTVGEKIEIKSDNKSGINMTYDVKAANNPGNKEMLYDAKLEGSANGEKVSLAAQGFWNDEKIAVAVDMSEIDGEQVIPDKLKDKYISVPSKTFGDSFMKSALGKEFANEFPIDLSGLDLSYSNLTDDKKDELKPLRKAITNEFLTLLENSDISKRKSVDFRFEDDKVSANKITITFEVEDLADFCAGVIEAAADDDYLKKTFGEETMAELGDLTDELRDEWSSASDMEFEVELIEYDGRIVQISVLVEETEIALKSTDKKHPLNGMAIEVISNGQTMGEVSYNANWADEDDEITVEGKVVAGGVTMAKLEAELNFDDEKFKAKATANGQELFKVNGKCSKKDGFSLTLDGIEFDDYAYEETFTQEYDEWFQEKYIDNQYYDYEYYYRNDDYSELYKIYRNDPDYYDYEEWYDDMGSVYDEDYMSYEDWVMDKYYDDENVKQRHEWDCMTTERVEYNVKVKATIYIKDSVDVSVKQRNYVNLFDLSMDELENLFN